VVSVNRHPVVTFALLAGLLVVPASMAPSASAAAGATARISVATGGTQANNNSDKPAISADGRYIAFSSSASNLVAGDTNGVQDVFLRDQVSGYTTRVSVDSFGAQANGASSSPAISADSFYVAYQSMASNLVAGDTNSRPDVFVYHRITGVTTRISLATGGTQANSVSNSPAISTDGRYVAFSSDASNLVAGDTNGCGDVFVRDRATDATTRVNVATGGTQANENCSDGPISLEMAISADGRYVAFDSTATNLVAGGGPHDVYVRDRVTGTTTLVSVPMGDFPNVGSDSPAISADGRYISFVSAYPLMGDFWYVFVHDRVTSTTTQVNSPVASDNTDSPALSADGRYVAFHSESTTNSRNDVFLRDRVTGTTTRVSVATDGTLANNVSQQPAISADGRTVAFSSNANNLVADDTNAKADVFVRDRLAPALAPVTRLSDFNKDRITDLVARDATGRLWLYPGNGSGYFLPRRQMGVGWNSMTALVTPGDVTGDGNADILGRDTAGRLWLYPGNGVSGFLTKRQIGSGWNGMTAITDAANLNGAGRPDLLARDAAGALWLYPLTGNAVFGPRSKIGTGWNEYTIWGPGDVSGDGRADILARHTTGSLWVYRGNGTGGLGVRTLVSSGWAATPTLVTPGNWDRAAGNDLLARDPVGTLWLYPGNNAGGLGQPRQIGMGWLGMTYLG
jgi:Tol biopolymer transport system component